MKGFEMPTPSTKFSERIAKKKKFPIEARSIQTSDSKLDILRNATDIDDVNKRINELNRLIQENGGEDKLDTLQEIVDEQFLVCSEIENRDNIQTNFELLINSEKIETHIDIKRQDGEFINLNKYLPKECSFCEGNDFEYSRSRKNKHDKKILFEHLPNQSAFLISLFHEIGHANLDSKDKKPSLKNLLRAETESFLNFFIKFKRDTKSYGFINAFKENIFTSRKPSENDFIPIWYQEEIQKIKSESERCAWTYALSELRKLKNSGIDIFAGFNNFNEIKTYIDYCLLTHERDRYVDSKNVFEDTITRKNRINSPSFKPLFVKSKNIQSKK